MHILKIKNGEVRVHDHTGSYRGTITGAHAVSANVQGDQIAVTGSDGRVRVYDAKTRSHLRTI